MGPGQYPQYTRAWSARKAVGSPQTTHHSTPPPHRMSPTTPYMGLTVFSFIGKVSIFIGRETNTHILPTQLNEKIREVSLTIIILLE